jgi:hypothetical protein
MAPSTRALMVQDASLFQLEKLWITFSIQKISFIFNDIIKIYCHAAMLARLLQCNRRSPAQRRAGVAN